MDPNLKKIYEANLYQLKKGRSRIPLDQARDYLDYILGHNEDQKAREFRDFAKHLKKVKKELRDGE